jgi:hypothetical protein
VLKSHIELIKRTNASAAKTPSQKFSSSAKKKKKLAQATTA